MLLKFSFALLSVGGAGYALTKAENAPAWLKIVAVLMAIASIIVALTELPRAVDGVRDAALRIYAMLPAPAQDFSTAVGRKIGLLDDPMTPPAPPPRSPGRGMLDDPAPSTPQQPSGVPARP